MTDPIRADRTEGPPLDGSFTLPAEGHRKPPTLTTLIAAEVTALIVFTVAIHSYVSHQNWTALVLSATVIATAVTAWLHIRIRNRHRS